MTPGLLVQLAATTLVVGALLTLGGMLRGPPLRPQRAPAVPTQATETAPPAWVCVTARSYCASAPRPLLEPCACLDAWRGWLPGRVLSVRLPSPAKPTDTVDLPWPTRPDPEETRGTWLAAP